MGCLGKRGRMAKKVILEEVVEAVPTTQVPPVNEDGFNVEE